MSYRPWNNSNTAWAISCSSNFPFVHHNWPPRSDHLMSLNFFRWTFWSLMFTPTIPRPPTPWRRNVSAVWTIFSHSYAKRSWKVSTIDCVCAVKAVDLIYSICYFNKITFCVNLSHPLQLKYQQFALLNNIGSAPLDHRRWQTITRQHDAVEAVAELLVFQAHIRVNFDYLRSTNNYHRRFCSVGIWNNRFIFL